MHINFKHIGRRVKEIRGTKDMSQAELAEQIDMSVPYISLIETGAKKASLSTLILIANALGVTVDALLNGNQSNDAAEYYCDLVVLIGDCNNYETATELNIRKGPGTNHGTNGSIKDKGVYTIVEESSGQGATKWGKLKSGAGWISLDYVQKR